jgi:hypothetical protein
MIEMVKAMFRIIFRQKTVAAKMLYIGKAVIFLIATLKEYFRAPGRYVSSSPQERGSEIYPMY